MRDKQGRADVIVDEERKHYVIEMFKMYSLGSKSLGDLERYPKANNITNTFFKFREPVILSKNVISEMLKNPFYCGYIKIEKYNQLQPQKYPQLITQELFDQCQRVTQERCAKNNRIQAVQTAKEGKDFIFRSLITCATTGKTVGSDEKK